MKVYIRFFWLKLLSVSFYEQLSLLRGVSTVEVAEVRILWKDEHWVRI